MATMTAASIAGMQQLPTSPEPAKVERKVEQDPQTKAAGFTFLTHRVRTALNDSAGDRRLNYAIDYVERCKPTKDKATGVKTEAKPITDPEVDSLIRAANVEYQAWLKGEHATEDKANYEKELKKWNEIKNEFTAEQYITYRNENAKNQTDEAKLAFAAKMRTMNPPGVPEFLKKPVVNRAGVERETVFKMAQKKDKKGVSKLNEFRRPNYSENPLKSSKSDEKEQYYDYALRVLKRERVRFSKDSYYAVAIFLDMLVRQILEATFEVVKANNQTCLTVEHFTAACATHGERLVPLLPLFRGFNTFRNPAGVPEPTGKHLFDCCTRDIWDDIKFVSNPTKKYTIAGKFVNFVNALADEFVVRFGTAIRRSLYEGTKKIQHRLVDKAAIFRSLGVILNYEGISEEPVFNHIDNCIDRFVGKSEERDSSGQIISPKVVGFLGVKSEHRKAMRKAKLQAQPNGHVPAAAIVMPTNGTANGHLTPAMPAMPIVPVR